MPVHPQIKAQIDLILNSHEDAAAFPEEWEEAGDVEYLHRRDTILSRASDADRVSDEVTRILGAGAPDRQHAGGGITRLTLPAAAGGQPAPRGSRIPDLLDNLDASLGHGVAKPDTLLYLCPHACPATEPAEVPPGTAHPFPRPAAYQGHSRPGYGGAGVLVSVIDGGLLPEVAAEHSWLAGVDGVAESHPYGGPGGTISPYAGHGTFVAGCLRGQAPEASVFVERAFDIAAADYESNLLPSLDDALDRSPDILVFTFTSSTRHNQSLITFDDLYERRIRHLKGLAVVAPAGNDGTRGWMYPACYDWVTSVGALASGWRDRASFSNFGGWVDVYAPGEDIVNAYPSGTYICNEPPVGKHRKFSGMANWSGTSFSTPVVAGLMAARMSATGENGQQAAQSLLRLARSQAIPGVGAVLYPGQADQDIS